MVEEEYWAAQRHVALIRDCFLRADGEIPRIVLVGLTGAPVEQFMFMHLPENPTHRETARLLAAESRRLDLATPSRTRKIILESLKVDVLDAIQTRIGKDFMDSVRAFNPIRQIAADMRRGIDCSGRVRAEPSDQTIMPHPATAGIRHLSQY